MTKHYLVAVGPDDLIRALAEQPIDPGIELGPRRPADGFADAADSPIGPEEIRQIFELITIGASAGTALVALLQKIKDLIRSKSASGGEPTAVELKDARSGQIVAKIDQSTDVVETARSIESRPR